MSNITLNKTEQNAHILLVRILLDESIDKILAEFMLMGDEEIGDEIFRILIEMVEQGKAKFEAYVSDLQQSPPLYASADPKHISDMQQVLPMYMMMKKSSIKLETTKVKISTIWPFAAWVPKEATWLLIEELDLRIKALKISRSIKKIEMKKQIPVDYLLVKGDTGFYDNTTEYIPNEAPPKWLQSVYDEYYKGKKDILKKISTPKGLFINAADMDKCIDALYRIRPYNPIIDDESRRWLNPRGAKGVLSAWVKWLEDNPKKSPMIHSIRPIKNIIPLLRSLFPGLNISERMLKDPDPLIVAEFKALH